jgi:hypothetical protein
MTGMSQQTIKQRARRKAHDAVARQRKERAERERRLEDLAVQVLTAVEERDAAVANTEQRAGAALRQMTEAEGLTLSEAVEWCGETVTVREATRLRRLADVRDEMADTPDFRPAAGKLVAEMGAEAPDARAEGETS